MHTLLSAGAVEHVLLVGVARHQAVDGHLLGLADAVAARHGLQVILRPQARYMCVQLSTCRLESCFADWHCLHTSSCAPRLYAHCLQFWQGLYCMHRLTRQPKYALPAERIQRHLVDATKAASPHMACWHACLQQQSHFSAQLKKQTLAAPAGSSRSHR